MTMLPAGIRFEIRSPASREHSWEGELLVRCDLHSALTHSSADGIRTPISSLRSQLMRQLRMNYARRFRWGEWFHGHPSWGSARPQRVPKPWAIEWLESWRCHWFPRSDRTFRDPASWWSNRLLH